MIFKVLICNNIERTENPRVGGSIPPLGTIKINDLACSIMFF